MKLTTVLYDLDGTLLPMDNDAFTKGYFKLLASERGQAKVFRAVQVICCVDNFVGRSLRDDRISLGQDAVGRCKRRE